MWNGSKKNKDPMNAKLEWGASLESEQALLGALLVDNRALARVAGIVTAGDFTDYHAALFRTIEVMVRRGDPADIVTVADELRRQSADRFEAAGGSVYLATLTENTASVLNAHRYAELIAEKARQRRAVALVQEAATQLRSPGARTVSELAAELRAQLAALADSGPAARWRFPARTFREVLEDPSAIDWRVDGYVPRRGVGIEFGASGSFKTFLAVDIGLSVATGRTWHGRRVKRGGVLYLSGEGALRNRFAAWWQEHGTQDVNPDLLAIQMPVPLDTPQGMDEIERQFSEYCERVEIEPALIVVDTLARYLSLGGDRNPDAVNPLLRNVDSLRDRLGCAVLIVHHVGHADQHRPRGMSDLPAAADFAYLVVGDAAARTCEFRPYKMKEAEAPEALCFRMRVVELPGLVDNFGHASSSLVPELTAGRPAARPAASARGKWQRGILEVLLMNRGSPIALEQLVEDLRRQGLGKGVPGFKLKERAERALEGLERAGLAMREGMTFRAAGAQADIANSSENIPNG